MVLNRKCHDDPVSDRMSVNFQLFPQSRKFFYLPKSELDKFFPLPQFTNSSIGHRTMGIRMADYRVKTDFSPRVTNAKEREEERELGEQKRRWGSVWGGGR